MLGLPSRSQQELSMSERVVVFDTTLRDGEQSAGVSFTEKDKLDIAERLAAIHVDVIEAGFPAASPGEARAVAAVAKHIRHASIRSEEHTSELQSRFGISYAVFC